MKNLYLISDGSYDLGCGTSKVLTDFKQVLIVEAEPDSQDLENAKKHVARKMEIDPDDVCVNELVDRNHS